MDYFHCVIEINKRFLIDTIELKKKESKMCTS